MIDNRTILVTGGAGFIGSHLVDRLAHKARVVVLDNLLYGDRENLAGAPHEFIEDDIVTVDLDALMGDYNIDLVFHLATYHLDDSLRDPMTDFTVTAQGGMRLLEACRKRKIQRLVYASSGSVYGEPDTMGHDEAHALLPTTPYGTSKTVIDHYCRIYGDLYGLDCVRLRYYNVYGPRRTAGAIPKFILTALAGATIRIEGGAQTRTPTNVDDIVEATIRAAEIPQARGEAFNLAAAEAVSVLDMAKRIVALCGTEDSVAFELTDYRPGEIMHLRPDVAHAKSVLGWEAAITLDDGLSGLIEHLREHGPST